MKILLRKGIVFVLLFGAMLIAGHAQTGIKKFEFGINLGAFIYQGDLAPSRLGSFKTPGPAVNIFASKILSNSFSLRTNLSFGKLKGDDAKYSDPDYRKERNFNFKSPVFEISELLVWNPLGRNDDRRLSPYLFGGAGLSFLHIKRDWSQFNANYFADAPEIFAGLAADSVRALPRLIPVIPIGIGLKYAISPRLSVTAETSYRLISTDYLDGFSQAANPAKNDHYGTYTLGLVYRMGVVNRLRCPVVRE